MEKKQLYFNTMRLAPFAFLQERTSDFPYLKWKLRCVSDEKAILDIQGKRDTFKFEIHPGQMELI
jgi:cancer susceptibility candidate protein 1